MELWDLYDSHRNPTGQTMVRGTPVPEGMYHLVVHVCIFNSRGEMLIQQRQPFKPTWGGMWDLSVGGGAVAGDSSAAAAQREVLEEIGVSLDFSHTAPACTVTFIDGFDDYYMITKDLDLHKLRLQPEEVAQVKWASLQEILAMIADGSFIPYHPAFLEFLFFQRDHSGTRTHGRKNA